MAKKSKDNKSSREAVGITIIIISIFFLMCLVYPEILSIIGLGIYTVSTGLLGVFAYAFFLIALLYGVFLLRNYKLNISKKRLSFIIILSFLSLLILQLITTSTIYGLNFNEYIASVYNFRQNINIGGVFFGILAYAIKNSISVVGAYISLATLFVFFSTLLIADILSLNKPLKENKRKYNNNNKMTFQKGIKTEIAPIKPIESGSLFIDNIIKKDRETEEGSFSAFNEAPKKTEKSFDDFFKAIKEKEPDKEQAVKEEGSTVTAKSILFSNQKKMIEDSTSRFINRNSTEKEIFNVELPKTISTSPNFVKTEEESPLKKSTKTLPEIVFIPETEEKKKPVEGDIINAEEYSYLIKTQERTKFDSDDNYYVDEDYNFEDKLSSTSKFLKPELPIKKESKLYEGIINCDTYKPESVDNDDIGGIYSTNFPSDTVEYVDDNVYEKDEEGNLIIYKKDILPKPFNDYFKSEQQAEESEKEEIIQEVKQEKEQIVQEVDESKNGVLEIDVVENEIEQLVTDDEFLEKSIPFSEQEIKEEIEQENQEIEQEAEQEQEKVEKKSDYTGYYVREGKPSTFLERVQTFERKIESKNQINIESYLKDESSDIPRTRRRKQLNYNPPPFSLLVSKSTDPDDYGQDFQANASMLEETLKNLKLPAKVIGITRGPAVTRYELEMPLGTTVKRIEGFSQDISYALASPRDVRIEAPIPGKRAVGVEVANAKIGIVSLKDLIESQEFAKSTSPLTMCVGKDVAGKIVLCNLDKMPHLLIAGSTNSGKSACLHSLITSILYKSSPSEVRFVLIDPKRVEFLCYIDLPHLLINEIINEKSHAVNAFKWLHDETENRYKLLAKYKCRNISEYNACEAVRTGEEEKLPNIVIVVDELADLMLGDHKKEIEEYILSISQKARAAGVHLILATQRPSVDVLTGTIKVNLPSRIALAVANGIDSKTILDRSGAEMLLGRGDLLYAPVDSPDPKRVQGAYVTKEEVESIVDYIKENNENDFYSDAQKMIMRVKEVSHSYDGQEDSREGEYDPLLEDVVRKVIETNQVSSAMLQRRFKLGYSRASRIIDQMEMLNFVGPMDDLNKTKPREIYITKELFKEFFGKDF